MVGWNEGEQDAGGRRKLRGIVARRDAAFSGAVPPGPISIYLELDKIDLALICQK
jgi:hypothetical protein